MYTYFQFRLYRETLNDTYSVRSVFKQRLETIKRIEWNIDSQDGVEPTSVMCHY